ncbi:MAG: hypothetical protein CL913_05285 [Deltaproteobacteria bacterium]|nr:hypothetical protein [Deltaproteobacteria bacterium]
MWGSFALLLIDEFWEGANKVTKQISEPTLSGIQMGIKVTRKKISITSQLMAKWVRQLATGKSVHYVMRRNS